MDRADLPPELTLGRHRLHDARALLERWEALARRRGWSRRVLATESGLELPAYEIGTPGEDSVYLSAGVHGDEPVPPWALWYAGERLAGRLEERGAFVVPLWNPDGLANNRRQDLDGRDPNRIFHERTHPRLTRWTSYLARWRFAWVLALHEDFDARGWYLYEISRPGPRHAAVLRQALEGLLEFDPRPEIEGRPAQDGLIWSETLPPEITEWPEVFALADRGEPSLLTFETPSEAALEDRALAHLAVLEALLG